MPKSISWYYRPISTPWVKSWTPFILLICAVFATYSNVYGNAFVYDDESLIVSNQFLRSWHYLGTLFISSTTAGDNVVSTYYRPLQILVYLIIFQIASLSQFAFHIVNISLHAANSCLVYKLGRKLNFIPLAAFLGALLWALHPLQTESVTYMSATTETLYTLFCLLGINVLLPDFTPRRTIAAAIFMTLGLVSKESAIIFPLLAMSCTYLLSKKRFDLKSYFYTWPLWLIAACYIALRFSLSVHGLEPSSHDNLYNLDYSPFAILSAYFGLFLWPSKLHMEHDFSTIPQIANVGVITGFALISVATAQLLRRQSKNSLPLSWALLWFASTYLLLICAGDVLYEHWMYLPSIGLCLGLMQASAAYLEQQRVSKLASLGLALALSLALIFAVLTHEQNRVWHDAISLYTNTFLNGEDAPKQHANLGEYYTQHGDYEKAVVEYNLAIKLAHNAAHPSIQMATAHTDLALTMLMMPNSKQNTKATLAELQEALAIDPNSYRTLQALSNFYNSHGDKNQATLYRKRAEELSRSFMTTPNAVSP